MRSVYTSEQDIKKGIRKERETCINSTTNKVELEPYNTLRSDYTMVQYAAVVWRKWLFRIGY